MTKKKRGGDGKSKYMRPVSLNQKMYEENDTELGDTVASPYNGTNERIFEHDVNELQNSKRQLYRYLKSSRSEKK